MSDPYRVLPAGIDADMKRLQWVNWADESDRGKVPKRPDKPQVNASSSDATTWSSFEDATDTAAGRDLGIGLSLAQASPFVALDIDTPGGDEWVPDLTLGGAVIERSPSGNLRVYLRDVEVPDWWTNQGETGKDTREVKLFEDTGYVTVTGDVLDGHGPPIGDTSQAAFEQWLKEAWRAFADDTDTEPWSGGEADSAVSRDAEAGQSGDLSADDARNALDHIDPDLPYDAWRNIGFALQDEFGDATGERLFKEWSRGGTKWDREAEAIAERIIEDADQGGDRTMGTVLYHAKNGGWSRPDRTTDSDDTGARATADGGTAVQSSEAETGDPDDADPWAEVRAIYEDTEATNSRAHTLAVDLLLTERPVFTARETDRIYAYDDETGYYDEHGATEVKRHLVDQLGGAYRTKREHEILARLRGKTYIPIDQVGAPDGLLCVGNGVLDLRDLPGGDVELLDHDPEYQFLTGLPVDYDPDADCPRFREVISDVVNDRHIETLQEYVGYTLAPWGQPFKRAAVCLGPKDSGKSTVLNVVAAMLGDKQNVANQNLYAIMNTRWGTAQLHGKMANITNELGTEALENIGLWKTLTGGERLVDAERKGEQKFQFRPTTKHLFATNHLPPADGADEAFHERFLHILFPKEVPESDRVRNLDQKIIDGELTGVLNWAIDGYRRLLDQDGFDFDPLVGEKRERWEAYGNSIERFKHNCFELTGDPDDVIVKSIGYDLYTAYCEHAGLDVESPKKVTTKLKEDKHISDGRRKAHPDDKRRTAYVGVRFNDDALDALNFDPGAKLDDLQQDGDDDEAIDEETYTGGLDQFD
jgi:putative DNA primase/helicase